jgi:hypothetical protein
MAVRAGITGGQSHRIPTRAGFPAVAKTEAMRRRPVVRCRATIWMRTASGNQSVKRPDHHARACRRGERKLARLSAAGRQEADRRCPISRPVSRPA